MEALWKVALADGVSVSVWLGVADGDGVGEAVGEALAVAASEAARAQTATGHGRERQGSEGVPGMPTQAPEA